MILITKRPERELVIHFHLVVRLRMVTSAFYTVLWRGSYTNGNILLLIIIIIIIIIIITTTTTTTTTTTASRTALGPTQPPI
jgi:hypothetical protein